MSMLWVGVGTAVVGAAGSYMGSKKQADAAKDAAGMSMEQYRQLRADQAPFVQSGYGSLGKLNTLLGLNPNPRRRTPMPTDGQMQIPSFLGQVGQRIPRYQPTAGGGVRQQIPYEGGQTPQLAQATRIRQLLALRAQNGDTQAASLLQRM